MYDSCICLYGDGDYHVVDVDVDGAFPCVAFAFLALHSFLLFFFGIGFPPLVLLLGRLYIALFYCIHLHLPLAFWAGYTLPSSSV